ncbi:YdbH domain-containing protein [Pelagicoccus sp. SDUM812005]|uniref:intermembrane phospholipid transport protein YdbH family protein n=1 Tax=Pelagicoccus sp. SDUM812005 TaxID=3041257 RepID=UPI00280D5AC2|nr:YdbH domain-containing protein [Pelagicoccus sp. SDUM812005]MDQ8180003.1 YdbH domain-containing protein [Pelagicoccus sp. SDUM812005]
MNPRLRKLSRILLRALLVLTVLLLIGAVALWGFRTRIATHLAKNFLQDQGVSDPELTITQLQPDSLTIESLKLAFQGHELSGDRIELSFDLRDLLSEYRIDEAILSGLSLSLTLPDSSEPSPSTNAPLPPLSELTRQLDLTPFFPLPFNRIQIVDSSLTLSNLPEPSAFALTATATAPRPDALQLEARLARQSDTLQLSAHLSSPHDSEFEATLHLEYPQSLLDSYYPAWSQSLPELNRLAAGPLDLTAKIAPPLDKSPRLELSLEIHDLDIGYEEVSAQLHQLSAKTTLTDFAKIPLQLTLSPAAITRETLSLDSRDPIQLVATITDFSVLDIQTQKPISWNYDSDYIQAASSLQLRYELENPATPLNAKADQHRFTANAFDLAPFTLTLSGDTQQLSFQATPLELAETSPATLRNGTGTIQISDTPSDPIRIHLTGELHPASLSLAGTEASLPTSSLTLDTQVYDTRSEIQLNLSASPEGPLASFPPIATLQGSYQLILSLTQPDDSDTLSGNINFDASNISIQSDSLNGNGIAIQSQIEFQDLDTAPLDADFKLDEASLTPLLANTTFNLDWQANQLATPELKAQWSGGSVSLKPQASEWLLSSAFGAGILSYDKLRIEQLYLENELHGPLENLEGSSSLSAMIDGTPVQASSQQTLENPLSNLSLNGEYSLSPLSFQHSDLPGRLVPELSGITVSADLQAKGAFHATADSSDATLSLTLRDGSLAYPASQLNARGIELDLELASLAQLDSGELSSTLRIADIEAGDLKSMQAQSRFKLQAGELLAVDFATLSLFGGQAHLRSAQIPIDGTDFQSALDLDQFDLGQITSYIDFFDGRMQGKVSGQLPFRLKDGSFELLRGELRLPDGAPASLRYNTRGLLTQDSADTPTQKPSFSDRLLKFLKIDPEKAAEQALGNITITKFYADLFPENEPDTPIKIQIGGTAHTDLGDVPVVIATELHGSLTELYNFVIRLNSL